MPEKQDAFMKEKLSPDEDLVLLRGFLLQRLKIRHNLTGHHTSRFGS